MSWFTDTATTVMDWLQGRGTQEAPAADPIHAITRRPRTIDQTESLTVNEDLTLGLWRNSYQGLKLGGSLAFAPIFIPVSLMGIPVPTSEDEHTQELLSAIMEERAVDCWLIHRTAHRNGTCWIWPKYAPQTGLVWEFIPDASVVDIEKDIVSGEVVGIRTDEQLMISVGEADVRSVRRKRYFTREKLTIRYLASTVPDLPEFEVYANPSGEIPIAFGNDAEPNETRGISDYARILPDLKTYHDVDQAWTMMLARFKPKLVLGLKNLNKWLENNGYGTVTDIDVASADLFIKMVGDEETIDIIKPPETAAYAEKLKQTFHKIVEGSGIPEIVWGLKTEGNHASAEEQMGTLVQFAREKQAQKNKPYIRLFDASLRLVALARMRNPQPFEVTWNKLDAVSDAVRSEIFRNYAQGIGYVMQWAGITDRQLHAIWQQNFPDATEEDYEEYRAAMVEAAKFRQFAQASLTDAFDVQSPYEEVIPPEPPAADAGPQGGGSAANGLLDILEMLKKKQNGHAVK